MQRSARLVALVAAAGVGVLMPVVTATASGARPVTASSAAASPLTQAPPVWATAGNLLGAIPPAQTVQLTLWLGLRDAAGAAAVGKAVSTPGNAAYRHYLTAAQFSAQFAPTAAQVSAAQSWLTSAGLTPGKVSSGRLYVQASAPAAVVESAFGTTLQTFSYRGLTLYAPSAAVTVPTALQQAGVVAVQGLDDAGKLNHPDAVSGTSRSTSTASPAASPPPVFANAGPCSAYAGQVKAKTDPKAFGSKAAYVICGNTVNTVRTAYKLGSTYAAGIDGTGQTVVVVDAYDSQTLPADANTWSDHYGVPEFGSTQYVDDSPPGLEDTPEGAGPSNILIDPQGWSGEQTLDVEAVHGMAPGATVVYDGAESPESLDVTEADAITESLGNEISNSWGGEGESQADATEYSAMLTQAQATGIGVYFSAGDSGDETSGTGVSPTPDFPASDDLVTSVGGTSIELHKNGKIALETGWGTGESALSNGAWSPDPSTPTYLYGGGGGISTVFAQPSYQVGVVPTALSEADGSTPMRVEPDIAAIGDPSTGFVIGQTQLQNDGATAYSEYREGGTSVSCPIMAGILALASEEAGAPVGFANPTIYAMAKAGSKGLRDVLALKSPHAEVRNDYASGQTSGPTTTTLRVFGDYASLEVSPGYDDVTGVGTPNGKPFVGLVGAG